MHRSGTPRTLHDSVSSPLPLTESGSQQQRAVSSPAALPQSGPTTTPQQSGPTTTPPPPQSQPQPQPTQGWSKNARSLVKMWAAQLEINRKAHQNNANSMGVLSTNLKIVAAVFGSAAAFLSFLNTTFNGQYVVSITLNIIAGLFAAVGTTVGVIGALMDLDGEAERHRQTAVQYANVCNDAQAELVEEDESNLPAATEYLKKMKDLTHLIQMFGPSLSSDADTELPSKFLLQNLGMAPESGGEPGSRSIPLLTTSGSIFDHERKQSLTDRGARLIAMDNLRKGRADIEQRKAALAAEENAFKTFASQINQGFGSSAVRLGPIHTNVSVGQSLRPTTIDNVDSGSVDVSDGDGSQPDRIAKGPNIPRAVSRDSVVIEIPIEEPPASIPQAIITPEMLAQEIERMRKKIELENESIALEEQHMEHIRDEILHSRDTSTGSPGNVSVVAPPTPRSVTPPHTSRGLGKSVTKSPIAKLFAPKPDVRVQVAQCQQEKITALNELLGDQLNI